MTTFIDNLKWTGGVTLRAAILLFAVEAPAVTLDARALGCNALETLFALLIAAFLIGVLALLTFVPLALLMAYGAGTALLRETAPRAIKGAVARWRTDDLEARRAFAVTLLSRLLALAALFGLALWPVTRILSKVETPFYAAVLSVALTLIAAAAVGALRPVWRRTAILVTGRIPKLPSPLALLAASAGAALLALSVFTAVTWRDFAIYLPWRPVLVIGIALALFTAASIITTYRPLRPGRGVRRILMGGAAALCLAGGITAALLPGSLSRATLPLVDAAGPVSAAYALITRVADGDGDGYLPWLAQGDCAPGDPTIHPGAVDPPGDGIDQDCDGEDSRGARGDRPGRHDYEADPRPRLVPVFLITVDAVSALHMELHGAKRTTMPFLTEKAKEGVVFNYAFSEGPATRLSVPTLLSGRHSSQIQRPLTSRSTAPWINVRAPLGTVFKDAGYRTEAVAPDLYFSRALKWLYRGFLFLDKTAAEGPCGKHKNGQSVTRAALDRLDRIPPEENVLLWVHYSDAHGPHRLPEEVDHRFGDTERNLYDRELRLVDEALEPLFDGIAKRMKGRDHIIALTADHGQAFDEKHGKRHQGEDLSTAVTWVPMIFWSPYGAGRRIDPPAQIIDVMPTLLNMAGLRADGVSGDSLLPAIQGRPDPDRPVLQQLYLHERRTEDRDPLTATAVRQGAYVLHTLGGKGERLYDFRTDPLETEDLTLKLPKVVRALRDIRSAILGWAYEDWNRVRTPARGDVDRGDGRPQRPRVRFPSRRRSESFRHRE